VRFRFIATEKAHHSLSLCVVLRVTRSGFYAWQRRPSRPRAAGSSTEGAGADARSRRASIATAAADLPGPARAAGAGEPQAGHSADAGRRPEGAAPQALPLYDDERSRSPVAANLLARQFRADAPNQRWVGDYERVRDRRARQTVPGGDSRFVLALRGGLGGQRRSTIGISRSGRWRWH
jgi:putative transposase